MNGESVPVSGVASHRPARRRHGLSGTSSRQGGDAQRLRTSPEGLDGVGDVVPHKTGRGYEDGEGTAAVRFQQQVQPEDDQGDGAMGANSRPRR